MADEVSVLLTLFGLLGGFGTLVICTTVMAIVFTGGSNRQVKDEPDGSMYVQKNGKARLD